MRNYFEQLVWLYSMGVEQVGARQPTNYSEVKIVKKIDKVVDQDISALKKTEEIIGTESEKIKNGDFQKELQEINNIRALDKYWRSTLINKFNIKKFWGLNELVGSTKMNILIIHGPPTRSDFALYSFLDGKKRHLINNIIFSILSGEREKEVENIFAPILPIPLNNVSDFTNLQSFHILFLVNLIRIIKPSLVLLVGDKATSYITSKAEEDDQKIVKENHYFSIPELEYLMSVPEVKKTVWEKWKQKRRTIKNDLFL